MCYMEEIITTDLRLELHGGCRSKEMCHTVVKRETLTPCSQCCNSSDECNALLCGLSNSSHYIPELFQLQCRVCTYVSEVRFCDELALCDNRTQECFMDQIIIESLTTLYSGGCRSREQCRGQITPSMGKRADVLACSRCCSDANDCNSLLCVFSEHDTNNTPSLLSRRRRPDSTQLPTPMSIMRHGQHTERMPRSCDV
ncbi:hypothetical protein DPMN_148074 [Dreissena polymorpha]|uniref:Uncharacterized protein n=1 Tax=Dreissena polymorpha TaxID=45954 RepID=A0A9D4J3L4_DREPO|nr:hypothetical protein DPMN_148074 [Dreissena polymorpha]